MNANHTAIKVMKQADAPPDSIICLSKEGGDGGWQVAGGPVPGVFCASPPLPHRPERKVPRIRVVYSNSAPGTG